MPARSLKLRTALCWPPSIHQGGLQFEIMLKSITHNLRTFLGFHIPHRATRSTTKRLKRPARRVGFRFWLSGFQVSRCTDCAQIGQQAALLRMVSPDSRSSSSTQTLGTKLQLADSGVQLIDLASSRKHPDFLGVPYCI